jgi:hypothetical protein
MKPGGPWKLGEVYMSALAIVFLVLMVLLMFSLAGWFGTLIFQLGSAT